MFGSLADACLKEGKERKRKEKKDDGMGLESHKGNCAMIRSRDP